MKPKVTKNVFFITLSAGLILLIYYSLKPGRVPVEIGYAARGPFTVTIDQQGETRAHDRFVISAPVAGRLTRIELHEGDLVSQGQIVALLSPIPLSAREKLEVTSRVDAAEAYKKEAEENVKNLQASHEQAKRERQRAEKLARDGFNSPQELEQARNAEVIAAKQLEAGRFKARAASSELAVSRAALIALEPGTGHLVKLHSPVSGRVLQIPEKSERIVEPGNPLVIIGDPSKLEVVADVLSTDAVKIKPGNPVWIGEWGGEQLLRGRVRTVEPYAFTKVSALGIEEQRVNVVADLLDDSGSLGDGYRVECHIVIWSTPSTLKIPSSALFRQGQIWCVFTAKSGKARIRTIQVGHRTPTEVEVLQGITVGESVILHPSNELEDGTPVAGSPQ